MVKKERLELLNVIVNADGNVLKSRSEVTSYDNAVEVAGIVREMQTMPLVQIIFVQEGEDLNVVSTWISKEAHVMDESGNNG